MLAQSVSPGLYSSQDPALLALIKCHLTSLAKWHGLRALCQQPDSWHSAADLARRLGEPESEVSRALDQLADEGVVERTVAGRPAYRLRADDPTTSVVRRLITVLPQSRELRQILVANLQQSRL